MEVAETLEPFSKIVYGTRLVAFFKNYYGTRLVALPRYTRKHKCSFQKARSFGKSREAFGSQNRILLNRRPHENLKGDGIWRQRASFSAKARLPLGFFLGLVCKKILKQKP